MYQVELTYIVEQEEMGNVELVKIAAVHKFREECLVRNARVKLSRVEISAVVPTEGEVLSSSLEYEYRILRNERDHLRKALDDIADMPPDRRASDRAIAAIRA